MTQYEGSEDSAEAPDKVTEDKVTIVTPKAQPWDKSSSEILKGMYAQGKSIQWIAHELGRTSDAIKMQASRMGLKRPTHGDTSSTTTIMQKRKATAQDIASRILGLLGEAPLEDVAPRIFSDLELMSFADPNNGLVTFLKEVLDIELLDYQLDVCKRLDGNKNVVVVSGRQCGKDWTIGCYALWCAIVKPNYKQVVVSAAQRQSDMLNERILGFMSLDDHLYTSWKKVSREVISFKNNSSLFFLPASGLIRGHTEIDRAWINEARDCPESTWDSVTPMLSRRGGKLAVFSTPLGRTGRLWDMWNSPLYDHVSIRSEQNVYLDKGFLEGERQKMSNASYLCEYEGSFQSSEANYFSPESIKAALEDYELSLVRDKSLSYSIGIDWGRKQDASVMLVLSSTKTGELRVAFIKSFEGVSFQDQLPYVAYLRDTFQPIAIIPERNGLGIGPTDSLERMGIKIQAFDTTNESKSKLLDDLRSKFDRHELTIPINPYRLQHELFQLEYSALPSGMVRISAPGGSHDDYCMALALANHGFSKRSGPDPDRFKSYSGRMRTTF